MMATANLLLLFLVLFPLSAGGLMSPTFVRPMTQLSMGRSLGALQELVDEQPRSTGNTTSADEFCLVDFGNFWRKTRANYTACDAPDRKPDFKSKGSGGSTYWDMGDYVIRYSNHWTGQNGIGRIVDCEWEIDIIHIKKEYATGMCRYVDFTKGKFSAQEKRKNRNKKR